MRHAVQIGGVALWLASMLACSEAALSNAPEADTMGSDSTAGTEPPADSGFDTAFTPSDTPEPAWFSLDATLVIEAGVLQPVSSTVTLWYWDEQQALATGCDRRDLAIAEASPATLDDADLELLAWWDLTLLGGQDTGYLDPCPGADLPVGLRLGVGPYDARLDPMTAEAGFDGSMLYGLYLQEDGDPDVLVFGVAGTQEQFDGLASPVDIAPLPDGEYQAHGLFLLEL